MAKTLSAIKDTARQLLRDEFVEGSDYDFADDELQIHINEALTEISEKEAQQVREILRTSKKTGTATATTSSHLIDTTNSQFVAGDVGKTVYNSTDGTTAKVTVYNSASDLTLDTDIMASGESYYIYHYQGASAKDLNTNSIDGLLQVVKAEYPTRQSPQKFCDVSVFGDLVTLHIDAEPEDNKEVFLYCDEVHTLTESSSSLKPNLERIVVEGVVAKAALAWLNEMRTQLVAAASTIDTMSTSVGNMTARITQAVADLTSGRALIAAKRTEALTAVGNMSARLTQAIADLTSGRAIIGNKRTTAITAIDTMSTYLTQAVTDLTSGRATIADLRTTMDTAIDNMSARITAAIADLTSGRSLINKVNVGQNPEDDYARYAMTELGNAAQYLNQARGYLQEATTSDRYANYAARDLQVAVGYLNQARGYLATDQAATEYMNSASREMQTAASYLNQARGYLATDQPVTEYAAYAARELGNANAHLSQATGYSRKLTGQLNLASAMSRYQVLVNNLLTIYQNDLKGLGRSRAYEFYPE